MTGKGKESCVKRQGLLVNGSIFFGTKGQGRAAKILVTCHLLLVTLRVEDRGRCGKSRRENPSWSSRAEYSTNERARKQLFQSTKKPARFVGQRGDPNELVNSRIRTNRFHCAAFGRQARDPGFRSEVAPAATHIQGAPLPQPDRQAPPHARL